MLKSRLPHSLTSSNASKSCLPKLTLSSPPCPLSCVNMPDISTADHQDPASTNGGLVDGGLVVYGTDIPERSTGD
jgi:hypothetical protein